MSDGIDEQRRDELTARRTELSERYLRPRTTRPASTARGVHHAAFLCSDVERTVKFFDGLLGFPLIEMFENRDYAGSTHFFFDIAWLVHVARYAEELGADIVGPADR